MSDYIKTLATPNTKFPRALHSQSGGIKSLMSTIISIKELEEEPGAIALLSDFRDSTDPKYIGPGTWNVIHRRAFKARNHDQQLAFIEAMKDICYGFPCTICRGHCTEYIQNHPLEEYLDVTVDVNGGRLPLGMFVWSWKFHNAVNARLKKPIMSWDTAYNLYSDTGSLVCGKSCLEADDVPPDGKEHDNISSNPVPSLPEPQARGFPVIVGNTPQEEQISSRPNKKILEIPTSQPAPFRFISVRR